MSEGLAQGPYVAAGVGFKPATLRQKAPNSPLSHHTPRLSPRLIIYCSKFNNYTFDKHCTILSVIQKPLLNGTYTYLRMYVCVYARIFVYMYVSLHVCVCIYVSGH